MRYFNTSGPNIIEEHYTLMRPQLLQQGKDLIKGNRYFTIWAPRQTGKSTYFQLLATELEKEGYKVAYINFENYETGPIKAFIKALTEELYKFWHIKFRKTDLQTIFQDIANITDKKLVLIIDEVEGINPEYFGSFLHSIRNVYHSRTKHALKSVILVGISNIIGVVQDNASPFNIADNLDVPYFTDEETRELIHQHETETGQTFEEKVKAKISYITANQPGLVNAFAARLVKMFPDKPIDYDDYIEVEDWFVNEAIDKNIGNIVNKAKECRVLVERLLFTEIKIPFKINREDIKLLYVNGLIVRDKDGFIAFRVPLYSKCLHAAFYPYMNGEMGRISGSIVLEDYFTEGGIVNIDKVINSYKQYALRRRFRYFQEKNKNGEYISLKEATLVYSFETYLNAFLSIAEGKSYVEAHTGLGRTDLIVTINNQEFVIEAKVYYDITQYRKGKKQLATYAKSLNLDSAIYLVFLEAEVTNPNVKESDDMVNGVLIKTHLIAYNLETDFND